MHHRGEIRGNAGQRQNGNPQAKRLPSVREQTKKQGDRQRNPKHGEYVKLACSFNVEHEEGDSSLIRLVVIAGVGLLGLSVATTQTPNELVGSVADTVKVINQVNVAIDGVGGLEEFLAKANEWLDQELAR